MPRRLRVSDVRRCLYWAAGGPRGAGGGEPSSALIGTLFHELFAELTGADERLHLVRPLERADAQPAAWTAALVEHAYAWHVAPALARHQAQLHGLTEQVLSFWSAVRALAAWLAELMWEQRRAGRALGDARRAIFQGHEVDAAAELRDPAWSDSVIVEGRIDAVLRHPARDAPCLVELKLGRTAPEADLCQAALYQLLLAAAGRSAEQVAVLAFEPEARELRFPAAALVEAQAALKALVGRLAGVADGSPAPPPAAPAPVATADACSELRQRLEAAYAEFDVPLRVDARALVGPTFVRFFAEPGRAVRLGRIEQLAESVWTRLRTDQPPHVSVVRGRIALDVQRPDRQTVFWRDLRGALPPRTRGGSSRFPVGVAVDGAPRWADLAAPDNCHFLVAGTSGSGKSEWLRAVLASLLAANTPATLRLLLVDPKRTAFRVFEGSACLWRPVVYPAEVDFVGVLDALVDEMEQRYRRLAQADANDLAAYNARAENVLPRVVCVCDEYADLVAERGTRRELEARIARLGAKARAAGIHLIFATQRPSRDVVQGVIDANLVARVALKVVRPLESRLILTHPGAATLLGRGDLLFRDVGDPVRLQSPFVEEHELRELVSAG